jgi:putative phage-type endonuclease
MPLLEADQRSQAWIDARMGKITASIAAACLGLDPYQSRQEAWRRVLGIKANHSNNHMRWGIEFEPTARAAYECESGNLVEETGFWVHPSLPWLGASPDGLVSVDGLAEIKCPTNRPEIIPVHHRIQMIVQLAVTGRKWCDYYAWTMHQGTLLARVFPSGSVGILKRLEAFYRDFVVTQTEPPRKRRKRT